MKAFAYSMTCLVILAGSLLLQAEPGGVLTFTIKADGSDTYLVQELNLTGGVPQVVLQQDGYPYGGIDAPPWMGDPFVVYDSGSGGTHPLIRRVGHYSSSGTVVDYTDVTRPADPGFSADGELVVFVYEDGGPNNEDELWTVTPEGMNLTQIYAPTPGQDLDFGRPRFAPDGNKIMFRYHNNATGVREIQMISVTGGTPTKVTNLPDNSQHPAISPDGQRRACIATNAYGTMTLFIAQGSYPAQQVNLGGQYALYPAFSPDSRYIAVVSDNGINIIELATNTVVRHLTVPYGSVYGLCWHLDAERTDGQVAKMKISEKALSIKTGQYVSPEAPAFGMVQVNSLLFPLDVAAAWKNKKDKKFMYNDKVLKRKAKMVVKSEKGMFSAKKLSLVENVDYFPGTNALVIINMGRVTMMEMVPLDEKGKYKRPKD
jgi:hypothetical protein